MAFNPWLHSIGSFLPICWRGAACASILALGIWSGLIGHERVVLAVGCERGGIEPPVVNEEKKSGPQEGQKKETEDVDSKEIIGLLKQARHWREFGEVLYENISFADRERAAGFLARAWTELEKEFAQEAERLADVQAAFGEFYVGLQLLDRAEPMIRSALEAHIRLLGKDNPTTHASQTNLAGLLREQEKLPEAESLYREILKSRRRVLGEEHILTPWTMTRLADLLTYRNKFTEAEPMLRKALEIQERTIKENHKYTLETLTSLAFLLSELSRLEEADEVYRRVLESKQRSLGKEHVETLTAMGHVAAVLCDLGHYTEAESILRDVQEGQERVLGKDHPTTLWSGEWLAGVLHNLDKNEQAEKVSRDVIDAYTRIRGPEHPSTARAKANLGRYLQMQGNLSEAETIYRESIAVLRRLSGENDQCTLNARMNLASLLAEKGSLEAAEKLGSEVVAAAQETMPEKHRLRAKFHSYHAAILILMKRYKEAEEHLLVALPVLQELPGLKNKQTRRALNSMVELYAAWDKPQKAEEYRTLLEEANKPRTKWR